MRLGGEKETKLAPLVDHHFEPHLKNAESLLRWLPRLIGRRYHWSTEKTMARWVAADFEYKRRISSKFDRE